MTGIKTILVTGATGNQGGAVATSLLKKGFKVKALTRNPDSLRAMKLKSQQAEIIAGDLSDPNTFKTHLKSIDGIFSVQTFMTGIDLEIKQGIALANLAKEYGVDHFVYSSVTGADLNTGIPHFESKFKIENHIRQTGLSYTIIRPASFYENFLIPQVKSRIIKGKLATPVNREKVQQFIGAVDIGEATADIFLHKETFSGKTITLAAEQMDMEQVSKLFTEVLGKEIKYQKLPMLIARLVMGKDLYKMFKWINSHDVIFIKDLEVFKRENPNLTNLEEWIKLNFNPTNQS